MNILDKNQTLHPPAGYDLQAVTAEGAYLRLEYRKENDFGHSTIVIYLTDMGREIVRTTEEHIQAPVLVQEQVVPVARRYRFRNGWLIILEGIGELIRCLRKQ